MSKLTKFHDLKKRVDIVWGERSPNFSEISKLHGSALTDEHGNKYWTEMSRSCFIAPNFYLEQDDPTLLDSFNCLQVGEDRDDRPLYYFLSNGSYGISSNKGLLFIAASTAEFFEGFVLYAEWIEEVLDLYGGDGLNQFKYSENNIKSLESRLRIFFNKNFVGSFWEHEILRLNANIKT